jgi:hypothetical protein
MSLKTRGSAALDKAQRRLALLKSIEADLNLVPGLTVEAYSCLIETTRATLEAHNTLLSNLNESRTTMTQMDKALSEMSERMLSAVAVRYGRNSIQYAKAGGSNRKRGSQPTPEVAAASAMLATESLQPTSMNGSTPATQSTS